MLPTAFSQGANASSQRALSQECVFGKSAFPHNALHGTTEISRRPELHGRRLCSVNVLSNDDTGRSQTGTPVRDFSVAAMPHEF